MSRTVTVTSRGPGHRLVPPDRFPCLVTANSSMRTPLQCVSAQTHITLMFGLASGACRPFRGNSARQLGIAEFEESKPSFGSAFTQCICCSDVSQTPFLHDLNPLLPRSRKTNVLLTHHTHISSLPLCPGSLVSFRLGQQEFPPQELQPVVQTESPSSLASRACRARCGRSQYCPWKYMLLTLAPCLLPAQSPLN